MDANVKQKEKYPECGKAQLQDVPSIVNGVDAEQVLPWAVFMEIKRLAKNDQGDWVVRGGGDGLCSGSLITAQHFLTAAHCFCQRLHDIFDCSKGRQNVIKREDIDSPVDISENPTEKSWFLDVYVAFEGAGSAARDASAVQVHESFVLEDKFTTFNDIALVTLMEPLQDQPVVPICLPENNFTQAEIDAGIFSVTFGYGHVRHFVPSEGYDSCMTTGFSIPRGRFMICVTEPCDTFNPWPRQAECQQKIQELKNQGKIDQGSASTVEMYSFKDGGANAEVYCPNVENAEMMRFVPRDGWCQTDVVDDTLWGFCSPSCRFTPGTKAETLQLLKVRMRFGGRCNRPGLLSASHAVKDPHMMAFEKENGKWKLVEETDSSVFGYGYAGTCRADSGAGSYFQITDQDQSARAVLVGLNSYGPNLCGMITLQEIMLGDAYVEVYAQIGWIIEKIDEILSQT